MQAKRGHRRQPIGIRRRRFPLSAPRPRANLGERVTPEAGSPAPALPARRGSRASRAFEVSASQARGRPITLRQGVAGRVGVLTRRPCQPVAVPRRAGLIFFRHDYPPASPARARRRRVRRLGESRPVRAPVASVSRSANEAKIGASSGWKKPGTLAGGGVSGPASPHT